MLVRVLKPDVLIGHVIPAVGEVLDLPDAVAARHVKAGTVALFVPTETHEPEAAAVSGPESADASPRARKRAAAAV